MGYDSDLSFNYFGPTKVVFGVGSLSELPIEVSALGRKAVLVTDEGLMATGLVERVQEKLGKLAVHTFSDVPQDSGMEVVDKGAREALSAGADVVISLGGGSVIDTAKGMSIVMTEGGRIRDFQGMQMLSRPQIPHIVIPTTAGTGSEVTSGAVFLDSEAGQKIIIYEYFITPRVAILDPEVTVPLPPDLSAATGMDAMTHAVESYVSLQRNPDIGCCRPACHPADRKSSSSGRDRRHEPEGARPDADSGASGGLGIFQRHGGSGSCHGAFSGGCLQDSAWIGQRTDFAPGHEIQSNRGAGADDGYCRRYGDFDSGDGCSGRRQSRCR